MRVGNQDMCYPSLNTTSDDTGISLSTVKRAIPSLANMGYLKKINHKKSNGSATSNLYRFTDKVYGTDKKYGGSNLPEAVSGQTANNT